MGKEKEIAARMRAYLMQNGISMGEAAERLGVTQQAVSNQLSGRKIGPNVARAWADAFGFRAEYLLTGDGPIMASDDAAPATDTVPLIPFTVRGGTLQDWCDGATIWDCEPIISPVKGAEIAFEVSGDSMAPGYPAGARVLLKKVKSVIAWGEVHVVDTVDGPLLKRIDQTDEPDCWTLRSDNPAYQPIRISTADVRGVWRVLLMMKQ